MPWDNLGYHLKTTGKFLLPSVFMVFSKWPKKTHPGWPVLLGSLQPRAGGSCGTSSRHGHFWGFPHFWVDVLAYGTTSLKGPKLRFVIFKNSFPETNSNKTRFFLLIQNLSPIEPLIFAGFRWKKCRIHEPECMYIRKNLRDLKRL